MISNAPATYSEGRTSRSRVREEGTVCCTAQVQVLLKSKKLSSHKLSELYRRSNRGDRGNAKRTLYQKLQVRLAGMNE